MNNKNQDTMKKIITPTLVKTYSKIAAITTLILMSSTIGFSQATYQPTGPAVVGVVVKGAAAQTANLQQWQNSAATVLSFIDNTGKFNGTATNATTATTATTATNLVPGTAGQIYMTNSTPAGAWNTMTGDATISPTGVLSLNALNQSSVYQNNGTGGWLTGAAGTGWYITGWTPLAFTVPATGSYVERLSVDGTMYVNSGTANQFANGAVGILVDAATIEPPVQFVTCLNGSANTLGRTSYHVEWTGSLPPGAHNFQLVFSTTSATAGVTVVAGGLTSGGLQTTSSYSYQIIRL